MTISKFFSTFLWNSVNSSSNYSSISQKKSNLFNSQIFFLILFFFGIFCLEGTSAKRIEITDQELSDLLTNLKENETVTILVRNNLYLINYFK